MRCAKKLSKKHFEMIRCRGKQQLTAFSRSLRRLALCVIENITAVAPSWMTTHWKTRGWVLLNNNNNNNINRFLLHVHYSYSSALEYLKLHTLRKRRYHLDEIFPIQVYLGSKFCPSVLEIVGLRVPTRHFRDFPLFCVCPAIKNRPFIVFYFFFSRDYLVIGLQAVKLAR
jgi:hypothetical protein